MKTHFHISCRTYEYYKHLHRDYIPTTTNVTVVNMQEENVL